MILALALTIACHTVEGDRLRGADLAAANPMFAAIDGGADLGPAPYAGLRRVMHSNELARVAARFHVEVAGPLAEACFERSAAAKKNTPVVLRAAGPPQVPPGNQVQGEVAMGGALWTFEARAESSGHAGEIAALRFWWTCSAQY